MKTRLIIILLMALTTLFALDSSARNARNRMVIISDVHLLSPELITPGSAIDRADAGDTKMMAMSDEIMSAITDSIIEMEPAVVLLTGDLTHNGERLSHERMAWHLDRMKQHGIQPLVIPGNHDCNNPYARSYDGDKTVPTATVTREEFAQIYRDFGYGKTSVRDAASLSYCCEPIKGIVIIGIDSNMDEQNTLTSRGDSADTYYNGGRIKPETMQWVIEQANLARKQGKQVIAMMHHHLVPHFDNEDRLLTNYIVGSAICYPFALRTATINNKAKTLEVHTQWLTATPSCPTLREQGRQRIIAATPGLANIISGKAWSRLGGRMGQIKAMLEMNGNKANLPETPQQATQLALRHLSEVMSRSLLAVVEGNEQEKDAETLIEQGKQGLRAMIEEVVPTQSENMWEFFLENVYPRLEPMVRSVLEDRNDVGTPNESRTDDLNLKIKL